MAAAVALLWPSRLAGAFDGAPFDGAAEALVVGLALPMAFAIDRRRVQRGTLRALIVALLLCKAVFAVAVVRDGWCVRFTSPVPLFAGNVTVPHAWDVRADWRSDVPRCSAIMTRGYASIEQFPAWFFNLPPATFQEPARLTDRPPLATLAMEVSGSLHADDDGTFTVESGEDVALSGTIDGAEVDRVALSAGLPLRAGAHEIRLSARLTGDRWSVQPRWDGASVFSGAVATMAPAGAIDRVLRPSGAWLQNALVLSMAGVTVFHILRRVGDLLTFATALAFSGAAIASAGQTLWMRMAPVWLAASAALRVPRRLRNIFGAQLLIGIPFMTLIAVHGFEQIGRTTWYTSGDDWWMFQRFAYRIYMQGFWLEGGEPAFWFQPFYRWIAGALHMIFGDSSVGEMFWDGACAWAGALFAFHVARSFAGFHWGMAAAALTLIVFTIGPGWYLFGRGLSELSSAGLIYAAALFVLRGRRSQKYVLAAALCLAVAFYTRLNNLPFAAAVAAFTVPLFVPAGSWWQWRSWWRHCSKSALAALAVAIAGALILFSLRTYYYTGALNALSGTQASARSVWQPGDGGTTLDNVAGSVAMVISMSDPPKLEPRAIPIVIGIAAAILGLAGVGRFKTLPLNVSLLCVAGIAGSFVARGSAYPGRFSIHLVPVTAALTVCAVAAWSRRAARP